jgi:hypothetical protein
MTAAFYAGLPRDFVPADRIGQAAPSVPCLRCMWTIDPISQRPIAIWTAEDDYLISFK